MFIDADCDGDLVFIPGDGSDEASDPEIIEDALVATEVAIEPMVSSPRSIATETTVASPRENNEWDQETISRHQDSTNDSEWWIPTSEDEAVEAYNAHGNDEDADAAFEGAHVPLASQDHAQPHNVDVMRTIPQPQTPPELLRRHNVDVMQVTIPRTPSELLRGLWAFSPRTPEGPPPSPEGNGGTTRRSSFMTLARRRERRNLYRGNSPTHATLLSMSSPPSDWESPSPESV